MSKQTHKRTFLDRCIKDENNRVVIGQSPNVPIAGWFLCMLAAYIAPQGTLQTGLSSISMALLIVWAYLEITQGVNYLRRALGGIVLAFIFASYFR